ncbi:uncharacterized protein CCOS01_15618 [Colletotrichum costaricense]|uniref:Peptidase A2 domain-containing protein n=1 Tax=Colletotrichum costaricense TaxID=1209916 RepID=A0AAJ0DTA3_9PEZI|nr:uncharacterized protein CCOS01_15618 [Colletotrichum costaricense]KAK1509102.1 hypothetical protein CCOS01_15618 [Colletotrichum costaricense]
MAASVYGIILSLSKAQNALRTALSRSSENVSAQKSLRRLAASMTMLRVMYLDLDPDDLSYRIGDEPATHIFRLISDIRLAELDKSLTYPSDNKLWKRYSNHVEELTETLQTAMQRLRDIEQTSMLRRIERIVVRSEQLHLERDAECNKTQQAVAEIGQALSLFKLHVVTDGRASENSIQQALAEIGEKLSKISSSLFVDGDTSDRTIEELRTALQSAIGRFQGCDRNRVVFPFVIPKQGANDVIARVILDTGAQDNWINTRILERANVTYDEVEGAGNYVGAGGSHFTPLGQAQLTWYSENQALSKVSCFLVHSDLPCDVILGSKYILASMDDVLEPVLPIRNTHLTKGESSSAP